nr:hypothetical protein L204_00876 [Cryptococcus depauperatus CBS 7855]
MSWAKSPRPPSPPLALSIPRGQVPLPTPPPPASQNHGHLIGTSRLVSPPTPAPSPSPKTREPRNNDSDDSDDAANGWQVKQKTSTEVCELLARFNNLLARQRFTFLLALVPELRLNEALVVSRKIEPLLRRDFLRELPLELALYCLSFVDDPKTLARAAQVSRYWNALLQDEKLWRDLFAHTQRHAPQSSMKRITPFGLEKRVINVASGVLPPSSSTLTKHSSSRSSSVSPTPAPNPSSSYKDQVKVAYLTENNWLIGGVLLAKHLSADDSVVTTLCFNEKYIIVGMANNRIHVFSAASGGYKRSLIGHQQGVWAMVLVTPPSASGGCDREVKVWNAETGQLVHSLSAHTSTIRCIKVFPHSSLAISGSRDFSLRIWDIRKGELKHTLQGHTGSVRCVEVWGDKAVSGSYDHTARMWDSKSGECLHTFSGHYAEIYSIACNGQIVITGSLDSTVRVWSAQTGECLALLQGHTALVGQLQLSGNRLYTGGSDGRVIIFDLASLSCIHRLCAHDNSVTCLQASPRFIVSGGNDGRVKLWDARTGRFVRELTKPCDAVWRVGFRGDRIVVLCQREGRTCLEIISFRAGEGERRVK